MNTRQAKLAGETDAILAFITAKLDERKKAAELAAPAPWVEEQYRGLGGHTSVLRTPDGYGITSFALSDEFAEATAAHIVMNDPAQILRDVAADRALLGLHDVRFDAIGFEGRAAEMAWWCATCNEPGYCPAIRALASRWSNDPEYRTEWGTK